MGISGIKNDAFEEFKTLKVTKGKLNNNQGDNFYLINTKYMPNFFEIIQIFDCQKYIDNENDKQYEENLIKYFNNYEIEKISFLTNFVQYWRLAEQDIEKENKFIIVEESFIEKMGININRIKMKKLKVEKKR